MLMARGDKKSLKRQFFYSEVTFAFIVFAYPRSEDRVKNKLTGNVCTVQSQFSHQPEYTVVRSPDLAHVHLFFISFLPSVSSALSVSCIEWMQFA